MPRPDGTQVVLTNDTMRASYNWLKEFVDFPHSPDELAEVMTNIGLNVESVDEVGGEWTDVVVGKVLTCEPVPETDHLSYCEVDAGTGETLGIVCGAPNVAAGQIVPVAVVGAVLPGGFKITKRKLKGVTSQGMICSEKELGISDEAAGIMVLPDTCKIGAPLTDYAGNKDWIFDVEITLNRGDCLSHLGMAREISATTGIELKMPDFKLDEITQTTDSKIKIKIEAPDKCPRYSARIVEGVDLANSPLWMQDRLRNLGVRPISNVVDVTNYVMLELGHPLHAFDYHLVNDAKIIVRTAEEGEKFITLDGNEHKLKASDLLITDPKRGIALAGVMGGLNTEVRDDTRDVLLECAYFEPVGIRITSRDQGISSESAHRFERGADPEMTIYAVNRAAYLINSLAGGKTLKGVADAYPKPWQTACLKLRSERVNRLLGTDIPTGEMSLHLKRLGCIVNHSVSIKVKPPLWKDDVQRMIQKLLTMDIDANTTLSKLQVLLSEEVKSAEDIEVSTYTWHRDLLEAVNKLVTSGIKQSEMDDLLERLDCEIENNILKVNPPSWRHDLTREVDLIEEVGRLHGFDKVDSAVVSNVPLSFDDEKEKVRRQISRIKQALVELGFREAINSSLVTEKDALTLSHGKTPVSITNPLSADMSHLRTSLAPSLMSAAKRSINAGLSNLLLFEWGKSFYLKDGKIIENNHLAGLIIGSVRPSAWLEKTREFGIYDLKGLLEQFTLRISLDKLKLNHYDIDGMDESCLIKIDGLNSDNDLNIGQFGRISTVICNRYDLNTNVWYFDFDGDALLASSGETPSYHPLPRYPAALRDLAFVVDNNIQAADLELVLRKNGGEYCETIELFDLFSGKGIPEGKKSLAFHISFRSPQRTLKDAEVDGSVQRIINAALNEVGAELRSI
ncbi:phenylalanine--tRNA ligase subunit beta [bacterium]|nr:phenylalanine--tRNA ligase subunit beta [bacterium]